MQTLKSVILHLRQLEMSRAGWLQRAKLWVALGEVCEGTGVRVARGQETL